jgi:dolichol-phosphate mannosyltransferase
MAKIDEQTLIIVPTYNERSNIEGFIRELRQTLPNASILVVDDNSPDGTGELVDAMISQDDKLFVLHRPGKQGLGVAYLAGFDWGLERGYERFFEMDADFSHDPRHLAAFIAALDGGADVVVGSRGVPGGRVEGWGIGRHVLSKGGSLYSRLVLGVGTRDLTTGYKAFTRRALVAIGLERIRSNGYGFQVEMSYRALRQGLSLVEVPIVFVDRRVGKSKMSRKIFFEAMLVVWRLRFDALTGRL